jgi:hypothetical protein
VATGEASLWIGRGYRIPNVWCILVKRCAGGASRLNAWSLGSRHFSYALVGRVWRSSRRAMPPRSRQGSYLLCGASNPMCTLCSRCQTVPGTLPASCNHARPFPLTPGKTRVSSLVVTKAPRCDSLHQRGAIGIENKRVICRRRETTCFASNKPAKSDAYPDCRFHLTGRLSGSHGQQTDRTVCWLTLLQPPFPSPNHSAPHSQARKASSALCKAERCLPYFNNYRSPPAGQTSPLPTLCFSWKSINHLVQFMKYFPLHQEFLGALQQWRTSPSSESPRWVVPLCQRGVVS